MYKCPVCDKAFPLPSTLKRHFRNHQEERGGTMNCSEPGCQFSSEDPQEYQIHLRTVHSLKLVPCAFRSCRLAFCTKEEMEQHRRNHFPFHCTQCNFITANAKQFGEHCRSNPHPSINDMVGKTKGTEKMEAHSTGVESCEDRLSAQRRPLIQAPSTADKVSQEEEDEEEVTHSTKKARVEKQREGAAATTDSKDCHIAKGTEHMYHTHICPECRRCFKKRTHLLEHMHLHFPDPSLQCPTCQHYFTSKSKLRIHMLREAGKKLHHCHLCDYSAVERNSLRRHLASIHGEEVEDNFYSDVYPCPTCGKGFRLSQALKAHMKTHHTSADGQPLCCFQEGCSFQSTDKKELQRHIAVAHGVKAVECRHHACSALFGSQEAMEAHHRTHLAFHCPKCDFFCSNKNSFQRHKRQGHPGTEELQCNFCPFTTFNPVEFDEHVGRLHANEKIHHCPQCNFVTAHKRVLGRHMLLHTECGYVTKWKHYLNVHMRKHAGDLRYQCNQCSYRCHRADQLSSHKLRHQEKSLICEVCAFSCKRKYELRKHMQLKHSQGGEYQLPVFQCKYCTYQTQYRQALHNHENCKHTRHREFHCALCSYSTFSSTSLFLHKRKVHGYVPGDKEWLENYAEKERENNASLMSQSFCQKQAPHPEKTMGFSGDRVESTERVSHQQVEESKNIDERDCTFEKTNMTTAAVEEQHNKGASKSLLKALKRQDKEQAEALVLQGRVQMLVVQTNTTRRYRLEAHESLHTGVGRHSCELCDQTFGTRSKLRLHRQRVHDKRPTHFCSLCDYSGYSLNDVSRHNLSCHTGELCHSCTLCDARFSSDTALKQHCLRQHQEPACHPCPSCSFSCRSQATLKAHILRKHPQLECTTCQETFGTREALEEHRKSHFTQKCPACPFATRERQVLAQHLLDEHEDCPPEEKPLKCAYHMRIHDDERKYLCPECGYKCKWVNQLKYHMTKHTGAKPYACEECEYRTNRADTLRIHRETRHREVRSFICEKCGKGFKTRFLLNTHQKKHSEERPYVCRLCHRGFRWPAGLRHHYLTHTQNHPFHCLYCSYCAKQKFQVVKHLQRHHPEQPVEQGVGKDPGPRTVSLQEARLEVLEERAGEVEQEVEEETSETNQGQKQQTTAVPPLSYVRWLIAVNELQGTLPAPLAFQLLPSEELLQVLYQLAHAFDPGLSFLCRFRNKVQVATAPTENQCEAAVRWELICDAEQDLGLVSLTHCLYITYQDWTASDVWCEALETGSFPGELALPQLLPASLLSARHAPIQFFTNCANQRLVVVSSFSTWAKVVSFS
ncbi:hypothetical protein JZ751_027870, partial [Albula glossodonta]